MTPPTTSAEPLSETDATRSSLLEHEGVEDAVPVSDAALPSEAAHQDNASSNLDASSSGRRPSPPALTRSMWAVCVGCVLSMGAWAFWPLADPASRTSSSSLTEQTAGSADGRANLVTTAPTPEPLQLAVFQTPLWVAPIPPPAPPAPPPPPPPLKLQLIAITSGPSEHPDARGALIFDPEQNKLFTVAAGDAISGRTILRITDVIVELSDTTGTRQLSLKGSSSSAPTSISPASSPTAQSPAQGETSAARETP